MTDLKDAIETGCEAFKPERDFVRSGASPGYVRFTDLNRGEVRVFPSSAAMRHCVRIFVEPHTDDTVPKPTPSGIVHPPHVPQSLHLCRGMAVELIAALQRFLDEPVDDELHCEWAHRIRRMPVIVEWYSTEPDENTGDLVGPVPGVKRGEEPGSGSWQHVFMVEALGTDGKIHGASVTFAESSLQYVSEDMCYKAVSESLRRQMMDKGVW